MTLLHVLKPYTLHNVWLGGFPLVAMGVLLLICQRHGSDGVYDHWLKMSKNPM